MSPTVCTRRGCSRPVRATRGLCDPCYRRDRRAAHANPRPRHPWDRWLDGRTRILTRGTDFTASLASLENQARLQAGIRGSRVTIRRLDGDRLVLQALDVPASR